MNFIFYLSLVTKNPNEEVPDFKNDAQKFKNLYEYTGKHFPIRIGNNKQMKSTYGWFKRRRLEQQLALGLDKSSNIMNGGMLSRIKGSWSQSPLIFQYMYREFMIAFKEKDFKTIKSM